MTFPCELKYLERVLNYFHYQPDLLGLLRIGCWTVLFLLLVSVIFEEPSMKVSHQNLLQDTEVTSMNTRVNDIRWVRNDFDIFPKSRDLNVVWISGSSVIFHDNTKKTKAEFLPQKVNQFMENKNGIQTNTFLYSIFARRLMDTYTMIQDALARKPDALVLVINPFWVYNNKAVFFKPKVFNHGSKLWWNKIDWSWQFTLSNPANHLYNVIGRHIPMITARSEYFNLLDTKSNELFGIRLKPGLQRPIKTPGKTGLKLAQPLQFWLLFNAFDNRSKNIFGNGKRGAKAWQAATISYADTSSSSWSNDILRNAFNNIKNSGVPTLLYIAPVSPDMKDAQAMAGYNAVLDAMQHFKNEFENNTFRFIVHIPNEVTESMTHKDYLHLKDPGKFPEFLSNQLSDIVSSK